MIIHKYRDGSEGYEYEKGDRVIVKDTMHTIVFAKAAMTAEKCVVEKIEKLSDSPKSWITATYEIRYSPDWGTVSCRPWQLEPHAETMAAATTVLEPPRKPKSEVK